MRLPLSSIFPQRLPRGLLLKQARAAELLNAHLRRLFTRRHAADPFPISPLFHFPSGCNFCILQCKFCKSRTAAVSLHLPRSPSTFSGVPFGSETERHRDRDTARMVIISFGFVPLIGKLQSAYKSAQPVIKTERNMWLAGHARRKIVCQSRQSMGLFANQIPLAGTDHHSPTDFKLQKGRDIFLCMDTLVVSQSQSP